MLWGLLSVRMFLSDGLRPMSVYDVTYITADEMASTHRERAA